MKKKTMRNWFIFLFILGVVAGWLIPMNFWDLTREAARKPLQAGFYDIGKRMGQLDKETAYFKYMTLAEADTGSVTLLKIDDKVPTHVHKNENHFLYIFRGRAKVTIINTTAEVSQGQILVIPAGYAHSVERVGESPVEAVAFSTPISEQQDTLWLEEKE